MDEKERLEALAAGNAALRSLQEVYALLNSAGNWGIVDILGGGFFTSLIKHNKMNQAEAAMEQARQDIAVFQRELKDLTDVPPTLTLNITGFLTFADFFLDGAIADILVQSKIDNAKQQTQAAIDHVQSILIWLNQQG